MKKVNSYIEFVNEQQNQSKPQLSKFDKMIDFTYIGENTTKDNLNEIIEIAKANKFHGIVVSPEFTDYLAYELDDSDIKVITTLDFPDGVSKDVDKLSMAIEAISDGTDEIDMVMWYKGIRDAHIEDDEESKQSLLDAVENDIRGIANECHKEGKILKVIIESGLLTLDELVTACQIATNAGADYIQTSTGTKEVGAELKKVKEMRRVLPDYVKIKVAGGITTLEQCNMYYPYVDRIGTSVIPK
jgi:deoxyribose-phosphate aldolase